MGHKQQSPGNQRENDLLKVDIYIDPRARTRQPGKFTMHEDTI